MGFYEEDPDKKTFSGKNFNINRLCLEIGFTSNLLNPTDSHGQSGPLLVGLAATTKWFATPWNSLPRSWGGDREKYSPGYEQDCPARCLPYLWPFLPFRWVAGPEKRRFRTGFGDCQMDHRNHGGHYEVVSRVEIGTRITLSFPGR